MINGSFELTDQEKEFMKLVREVLSDATKRIHDGAPPTCDIGCIVAGTDLLQQAKNKFCDAAILGKEADTRKKRKVDSGSS